MHVSVNIKGNGTKKNTKNFLVMIVLAMQLTNNLGDACITQSKRLQDLRNNVVYFMLLSSH